MAAPGGDPIPEYLAGRAQLDAASTHVEALVASLQFGATALRDWRDASFSNVGGIEFPFGRRMTIMGDHWPSTTAMAQAISDWHKLNHEVNNAWNRVPENLRADLQPPQYQDPAVPGMIQRQRGAA